MKQLEANLEEIVKGKGGALFILGEAGIGKTRLLQELKSVTEAKGFHFLCGNGLYESLTPYMPIYDALRSGGLDHLFAEDVPRVEAVYLVTRTGLLIKDVIRKETELSSDIFASMLTTVGDFVKESMIKFLGEEKAGSLNTLGYEEYRILIESGESTNLVVVMTGRENEFLIDDLREMRKKVENEFGSVLTDWDGDDESVRGIERILLPLVESGKYDGIYYGKSDPKAKRNILFQNVSLGLSRLSEMKPTVLCIEDLQWVDPSTLALMHHIALTNRDKRLLVLGTYRPEDIPSEHALVEIKQKMDRDDLCNEVSLGRLPREVMSDFFGLLGPADFNEEFTSRVYSETEGNPLFIIQLLKYLVEDKVINCKDGVWRLVKSLDDVAIPSKVYNVILRRLNRVKRDDRRLLDLACVNGEVFTSAVLAAALNARKSDVLERLRDLERTHRLINSHNGSFKFDHAKIKEVLYNEIPDELKREYHETIAKAIEGLNRDKLESVVGDLAFHYYHSRNGGKALNYLYKSAEKARNEYSNEEAIRFYNETLEFEDDVEKWVETLEAIGDIYLLIGNQEKSLEFYQKAIESASTKKKGRLKAKIGRIHNQKGEYEMGMRLTKEAFELVRDSNCDDELVVIVALAACHYYIGEYEEAISWYEKALEVAEGLGDRKGVAVIHSNIGLMYHSKGDRNRGLECYEKALKILEEIKDVSSSANSLNLIGVLYYERGEPEKALESYGRSLLLAEKMGDQGLRGDVINNIGLVYIFKGEYETALEHLRRANVILGRIGKKLTFSETVWNIGHVYRAKEEYDKALEYYEKGLVMTRAVNSPYDLSLAYSSMGCAYQGKGEFEKAFECHDKSLGISEKNNFDLINAENYASLGQCYLNMGDLERALEYCDRTIKISEKEDLKDFTGIARYVYGMIHREQKRWQESIENFTGAVKIFGKIGLRKRLGDSHFEFGKMWIAKGEDNEAKRHLQEAKEIYTQLKIDSKVQKAMSTLETLHD